MADIMVSYSHDDRARIRPIVDLLEDEGWHVWWDRGIEPGTDWSAELEVVLRDSRCVLVIWSEQSRDSKWVRKEANIGKQKNALVQVMIDEDAVPSEFADYQSPDLSKWTGQPEFTEITALLSRLNSLAPPSRIDTVRPGFDRDFLGEGAQLEMPGVTGSAAIYRYLHFTVVMNPGRRMAHYVAYNMCGSEFVSSKRQADRWSPDPLLPPSLQLDMGTTRGSNYHRGHLVSRAAISWGDERRAGIACRQAFFWTNVTPQTKLLNMKTWLAVEIWERELAKNRGSASGFSGPVLSSEDPPFRGEVKLEDGVVAVDTMHIPQAFWKVVLARGTDGGLEAASFLIEQDRPPEGRDVRKYAVDLKVIEKVSGVRFGREIHGAEGIAFD